MYSLHLTPEQLEIRDTVRDFAAREIKPLAEKSQRMEAVDRSPMEGVLTQAAELGLRTLSLPEDMGGAGADALTSVIVAEELAFGDPDTASILAETSRLARVLIGELMSPAQRASCLASLQKNPASQLAWASSLTGTDLGVNYHHPAPPAQMSVTATKSGNNYVLNGVSRGVANAPTAALIAVSATTDAKTKLASKSLTLLVPRGAEGMTIKTHASGRFVGSNGDITFDNCKIPADHLLGKPDAGATVLATLSRLDAVPIRQAVNLGIGRAAYEAAIAYGKLRVQGGRPIIEHQAIALKLADAAVRLETARAAIWAAAWACDHPDARSDGSQSHLPLAAIARIHTAETMYRVAKDCAECFGAMSVMRDMPLHKFVEDARRFLHADGGITEPKLALAEAIAGFRRD